MTTHIIQCQIKQHENQTAKCGINLNKTLIINYYLLQLKRTLVECSRTQEIIKRKKYYCCVGNERFDGRCRVTTSRADLPALQEV